MTTPHLALVATRRTTMWTWTTRSRSHTRQLLPRHRPPLSTSRWRRSGVDRLANHCASPQNRPRHHLHRYLNHPQLTRTTRLRLWPTRIATPTSPMDTCSRCIRLWTGRCTRRAYWAPWRPTDYSPGLPEGHRRSTRAPIGLRLSFVFVILWRGVAAIGMETGKWD